MSAALSNGSCFALRNRPRVHEHAQRRRQQRLLAGLRKRVILVVTRGNDQGREARSVERLLAFD